MDTIKDTYKDTKVGRIPKDWEVKKFHEVFNFIKTSSHSKKEMIYSETDSEIYNVHYGAIHTTYKEQILDLEKYDVPRITDDSKLPTEDQFLIDGDLVIVDASEDWGGMGECVELKNTRGKKVIGGLHTYAVRDKVNIFFKGFTGYIFQNISVRNKLASFANRSKVYGITKENISNVPVVIPPLPEQRKIAQILSTVDEQINTTDKIIEKSKELKKGLMQRFFLNKAYMIISLGKVEKTEFMPIRFSQLGKILTGTTPPTAKKEYYDSEDYMFIGPADLGKVKYVKSSKKYISEKGFEVARKLPKNAVMVVCIGATIGKIGLTIKPCATNQQVNTIIPKEEYSARYLYYVISGLKKYLLGFAGDTATPQLNKTDFGKVVTFIHKSKSERTKIAEILSEADAKIEREESQKAYLEKLKKGLMQQLLTGKKRVKV